MGGVSVRRGAASVVAAGMLAWSGAAWSQAAPAVVAAPVVAAPVAAAPAVSTEGASALAAALDEGLKLWFPSAGDAVSFRWDGKPTVTLAGDHYDVVVPSVLVTGNDGNRIALGVTKLSLAPVAGGLWSVAATFPSTVTLQSADGKPGGEITIGSQYFLGRWSPALQSFTRLDSQFGAVKATAPKGAGPRDAGSISFEGININSDLREEKPGRWTGPGSVKLTNVRAVGEKGTEVAHIGSVSLSADVRNMDLAATSGVASAANTPAAGDSAGALRRKLETFRTLLGGASGRLEVRDVNVLNPTDDMRFTLGRVAFWLGADGLDGEKTTMSVGYEHSGLKVTPSPAPTEFTPAQVVLSFALADLPNSALWTAAGQVLEASAASSEAAAKHPPAITPEQVQAQIMAEMTKAGTNLKVEKLHLETSAVGAAMNGEARFNQAAAFGLTGKVDLALRGLEKAIALLQPPPGSKGEDDMSGVAGAMSLMQAFGAPGKDDQGREVRSYKAEVTQDGKIMLNGADMSALLGAGPAPSAEPHTPPAGKTAPGGSKK